MRIQVFVRCDNPGWLCSAEVELESWTLWRVVKTQCTERLGPVLGKLKPCYKNAQQPDRDTRWEAVRTLEKAGRKAVPLLLQAMEDPDDGVVRRAAIALGIIKDERAIPALTVAATLCEYARDALRDMKTPPIDLDQAVQVLANENRWGVILRALRADEVREAVEKLGEMAFEPLASAMTRTDDAKLQAEIASLLAKAGKERALPLLEPMLVHENWWARAAVFEAIKTIGKSEPIVRALANPYDDVRESACKAVAEKRIKYALPKLIQVAQDPEEHTEVVAAAVYALGCLKDPACLPTLEQAVQNPVPHIRFEAVRALVQIGTPEAIALLKKAAHDQDHIVRKEAQKLLEKLEGVDNAQS